MRVKTIWDERYGEETYPERYYLCELDWYFEGRSLIVEEHPTYTYAEKNQWRLPSCGFSGDHAHKMARYREDVWPSRYVGISDE